MPYIRAAANCFCPQVNQLLLDDPENEEYQDIYNSLQEVIDLTRDLLKEADAERRAAATAGAASAAAAGAAAASVGAGASTLPASVAEQIRAAQVLARTLERCDVPALLDRRFKTSVSR